MKSKTIELLQSPLDKDEPWEKKNKRKIEIGLDSDSRGLPKNVYFGILIPRKNYDVISEDFFLTPKMARKIAKYLNRFADKAEALSKQK
jgi:hypothetical protein